MSTNIQFKSLQCHDDRPHLTQLDGVSRILAFVGNHDITHDWLINEPGTGSLSDFDTANAQGTWSVSGGSITGVGGGAAQWYKIRHTTPVELGFVAQFDWSGDACGYLAAAGTDFGGLFVWWDGTDVSIGYATKTGHTDASKRPFVVASPSTVTVGVWPKSYYSLDTIDDLLVAVWFDGELALAHFIPWGEAFSDYTGFATYQSGTVHINNYKITELHQIQEWTSVGPGETAGSGLSRVIGQEDILARARYDGTIRVWVEDSSTSDLTIDADRPVGTVEKRTLYWPSHVRMSGALYDDDKQFRDGGQGHIFAVAQDPNAMTADATHTRGLRLHARMEEAATSLTIVMPPILPLEPEDIITYNSEKWRVKSFTVEVQMSAGESGIQVPVLMGTYHCQKCLTRNFKTGEPES